MRRFYCPFDKVIGNKFIIDYPDEVRHILKVMRLTTGDELIVFDGRGREYIASISTVFRDKVEALRVKEIVKSRVNFKVTLACAIPKKGKFEFVIEKATELGVSRIIPMLTERTEVRVDSRQVEQKKERWAKIALNASKQSQRSSLPEISGPVVFNEVFAVDEFDLILIPSLVGERRKIIDVLAEFHGESILVLIGPEGDFSVSEVEFACFKGALPVSLGEAVLKVDTAVISALAIVNSFISVS